MKLSNIHSKYIIQEIFSFISEKIKFKLIKNNLFLINKLDLSIKDFKIYFFQKKLEKYYYVYIKQYYEKFKKIYNSFIQKEDDELKELFYKSLSKNKNFELNLIDEDFNLIFNNSYFKKYIRINLDELNEINISKVLQTDNKLIDFGIKMNKNIFKNFSTDGIMNKMQFAQYLKDIFYIKINENEIDDIFRYNINRTSIIII